jgi:hypothetical protein
MIEGQTEQTNIYRTIANRLSAFGIERIAIIDDAYDPPTRNNIEAEGFFDEFFAEVDADAEARSEIDSLGLVLNDVSDITDEFIGKVYSEREKFDALKRHCRLLFQSIDEKISQLKPLYDSLKNDLGCEVDRFGTGDELTDLSTKIIFIDYFLGPGADAYQFAQNIARSTYDKYKDEASKPLIILMSSKDVSEETVAAFRDESGLLGGTFYFVEKRDFSNKDKFHLKLGAWILALPYSEKIQTFVNEIETSIDRISKQFIKDIRKLSVDDYAYIQKLSLQDDGHPLGDYMIWLYSAYFGKLLFEDADVYEHQAEIDEMTFNDLPPSQIKPSLQLAEMYKSALFATVKDAGAHPRDVEDSEIMYLHLGDLFTKDGSNQVWMVINAQCDLAFAPDASRIAKPDRSIILIPGKLNPLNEKLNQFNRNVPRTELFEYQGSAYRILWNTKNVISLRHKDFKDWKEREGYKREVRLRLPFALEIQRAFASDLTRVGMPVAPPIYQTVMLQLMCCNQDGKAEQLLETDTGAYMFYTRDAELCVLSEEFVAQLKTRIGEAKEHLKRHIEKLEKIPNISEETLNKVRARATQLNDLSAEYDLFLQLRVPFELPPPNEEIHLENYPIIVTRKKDVKAGASYRAEQPLMLVISNIE